MSTSHNPSSSSPSISWTWWVLIVLIIVVFIFSGNNKSSPSGKEKIEKQSQYASTQNTKSTHWEKVGTKTITFGPQYGETIYLEEGKNISFEEATEPYCIMNANNEEFCANKGEDPSLPKGSQNTELRFKSQSGNNGSVVIIFWGKK